MAAFDYHYHKEAEQYAFFRIPKILISDPDFKGLSTDAKLLYGLMLDRMSLSFKNNWMDERGRVYIYFTMEDVCEQLCCKNDKALKLLAELDTKKGFGLIERVKQGQGRPTKIYVKRFILPPEKLDDESQQSRISEVEKTESKTSEKSKSAVRKSRSQDFGKTDTNNTEKNHTEYSKTELSIYPSGEMDVIDGYRERVKENISYELLMELYPYTQEIGEIVELMVEVFCTQEEFVKIGKKQVYTALLKDRLQQLNYTHIEYIMESMKASTAEIRNIKAYLLEALFNAPVTMNSYYQAKVNHDFYRTS